MGTHLASRSAAGDAVSLALDAGGPPPSVGDGAARLSVGQLFSAKPAKQTGYMIEMGLSAGPSSLHAPAALLAREEAEHGRPSAIVRVKIKK